MERHVRVAMYHVLYVLELHYVERNYKLKQKSCQIEPVHIHTVIDKRYWSSIDILHRHTKSQTLVRFILLNRQHFQVQVDNEWIKVQRVKSALVFLHSVIRDQFKVSVLCIASHPIHYLAERCIFFNRWVSKSETGIKWSWNSQPFTQSSESILKPLYPISHHTQSVASFSLSNYFENGREHKSEARIEVLQLWFKFRLLA